jgi:hypothetical protein
MIAQATRATACKLPQNQAAAYASNDKSSSANIASKINNSVESLTQRYSLQYTAIFEKRRPLHIGCCESQMCSSSSH